MTKEAKTYGRAYAFMDLYASREQIEAELPRARQAAKTLSQLEVSVKNVKDLMADRNTDTDLVRCLGQNFIDSKFPEKYLGPVKFKPRPKPMSDLKYALEAR